MVKQEILNIIVDYIQKVHRAGIEVETTILFGSYAQGKATSSSDIDIIVIAPEFDRRQEAQVNLLWELRASSDFRIEPIACGSQQWLEDDSSPILAIARDQGVNIPLAQRLLI